MSTLREEIEKTVNWLAEVDVNNDGVVSEGTKEAARVQDVKLPEVQPGTHITVYITGGFGNIVRYEGKYIAHGTEKYAQYDNCPFFEFIPKGKRTKRGQHGNGGYPYILILEGHGHPIPADMYSNDNILVNQPEVTVSQSRYSSFDPRWKSDFEAIIDPYIEKNNVRVIADYRHTKGFNAYKAG